MATRANPFTPGAQYVRPKPDEKILTARPNVRFLSQAVQPPSQVYVELADVLRIAAASSQANEVLTVNYRLLLPSGDVTEGQSSFSVTSNRAVNIHDEPLAEGFLLSCSCKAASATSRGQTFVRIFLTNPVLGQGQPSYMLMSDYVTTRMAPAHPNGRQLSPVEGPGNVTRITLANPAPDTDWTFTVPTNARWRPIAWLAALFTDGTAGNRTAAFIVTPDGAVGNSVMNLLQNNLVPSYQFNFNGAALGFFNGAIAVSPSWLQVPIPPGLILLPGGTIASLTTFVGPADNWQSIRLLTEEWLDNV